MAKTRFESPDFAGFKTEAAANRIPGDFFTRPFSDLYRQFNTLTFYPRISKTCKNLKPGQEMMRPFGGASGWWRMRSNRVFEQPSLNKCSGLNMHRG
jgi:hypothetical protein